MNFKSLLLGSVTVATAIVGGTQAMAGYVYDGVNLMEGSDFRGYEKVAGQTIGALNELGIPVVDGGKMDIPYCEPKEESYTMGFYVPSENFMVICTNNIGYGTDAMETLTHETVHVIQDLRVGLNNSELGEVPYNQFEKLASSLPSSKANTIVNLYDKEDWVVETEAFYFETQHQTVANEISRWAF